MWTLTVHLAYVAGSWVRAGGEGGRACNNLSEILYFPGMSAREMLLADIVIYA